MTHTLKLGNAMKTVAMDNAKDDARRIRITLTDTVTLALALDDTAMQRDLDVMFVQTSNSGRRWVFEGTVDGVRAVLDDVLSRSQPGNWDQPRYWMIACRRAWPQLKAQVEAQGYAVTVKRQETVVITPS